MESMPSGAESDVPTPEYLPLKQREVEIKPGLSVQFLYPPHHSHFPNNVSVLVDFKKLMQRVDPPLFDMPKWHKRLYRSWQPRDEYEADDMASYRGILHAVHKRGELDMPEITYSSERGTVGITQGRHRLQVLKAAGAEQILVLVHKNSAAALAEAVGVHPPAKQERAAAPEPADEGGPARPFTGRILKDPPDSPEIPR